MKPETFYSLLAEQNLPLSDQQKKQFERYFELLVEWNEKMNLTAITDKEEVYLKHFYDSLAPILQGLISNETIKLLDIGAGAGFPSLPMKILYPQLDVTIIDSLNKRINFLQLLAQELDLDGVHFYHGRAEDFAQDKNFRAQFDVVTARAVARMQVLSELTIPYLKVGGKLLALKASNAPEELLEAKNALNLLFSKVEDNLSYALPNGDPRYITVVEKKKETPNKYPRKAGMPINARFKFFSKKMFIKLTSLSHFWAREKMIYKINLALTFLSSGKNDLQNHFFLLYYHKQRFLMSSREVTKTQYMKFFKNGIVFLKKSYSESLLL